jgi:hypothetical protein
MKFKFLLSLSLLTGLAVAGFAQHEGHSPPSRQPSQTPPRQISDLAKDGENGLRAIRRAVEDQDRESLDQAVKAYLLVLSAARDAMTSGDPDSRDFDRDLARVERMSRTNLESLADLRRTAPANLLGSLEDAATATRDTYVAATDLRDEIANSVASHHGGSRGRGSCAVSYGSGCGRRGRGLGWGWLSRLRGC